MSEYTSTVVWQRDNQIFTDNQYSRAHIWQFDGGLSVPASSSPHVVPIPYSVAENVDPEEAFVAALSSCHMLFFLAIAAKRGFVVDEYRDEAVGLMDTNKEGKLAMTKVTLRPLVRFLEIRSPVGSSWKKSIIFHINSVLLPILLTRK
ncbi:OsmC family protein [Microbulbifer sp. MLAF003]|uniref:OsmC family protein n=1 Tax=Microbulbifer sp. MLAF003 TaxID=3032582 RepID=UPI0024ACCB18|nr:OsmC family protein [Microbulbifer sp. MLAF003]WHI50124.1 OsmC family protein [Microbulbifer sp. MLAF003]